MTRKAEEEFNSEFASGVEYPSRFQYSNRLVQLERPSAASASAPSAPVQRPASESYHHNQNFCNNNATDPPSSSSTIQHNHYSRFLIYPQNTSTTTGELPKGHCSDNSVQSITDSSTSTANLLPSSSYLNYIQQQRSDPTKSQQHPNIHHSFVNVDPNLTTPSPNMQAPNNHHGAGGGGNPNPANPHPHIGHHVTDNVNAANGNENAMNGNPNSATDTSYASAYNLLMNHPSMAQAAALTAALQNILRNVPLPAQGGAGMAGYNLNNPHPLVSGVAGSVPGPGAQQIPQQAQQQVSQQQPHSITSSSSASTVHMGAPTQQQQQPSSIGAHLKMAHVASVPQPAAAAAPSGSAATADHSQMVSISQLLNNAAGTGHSFNNASQPTQKHVAMSQHGLAPAAVSAAPINSLSSAMSTPSPHPMSTQPTAMTRIRKVKTVGPKVGGPAGPGVIPQPSPQVVSSSQPNVVAHQRATPATHRAAATPFTTWSLPQLERQVKFLQHTQQPIPGPLKLMLADAKRREEKKTLKRAANRKSASESRARKKAFVEEMTKTNERLKRHAQILALLPDLVVCIQLDGKITFVSAQVSSIWFWKNKVTD